MLSYLIASTIIASHHHKGDIESKPFAPIGVIATAAGSSAFALAVGITPLLESNNSISIASSVLSLFPKDRKNPYLSVTALILCGVDPFRF